MHRRLLPTLLALGCGLLALGWGLVSLQRIFTQERDDARAQVRSRREALEQLATEALRRALARKLEENVPAMHAAMGDALAPGEGFYLSFGGHQYLPRLARPLMGNQAPARAAYEAMARQLAEGAASGPWHERLTRLRQVEVDLDAGDRARTSASVEELLRYHAAHPLPSTQELPFTLLVVERLRRGAATPPLVRSLLREGLPEDYGGVARGAGLQRDLLRGRDRITQADFDFLHERIVQVSTAMGERSDDFQARAREEGAGALVMPAGLVGPILLGERWYVEPGKDEVVRGLTVDVDALLGDITQDLRRRGLFGTSGRVLLSPSGAVRPLSDVGLVVAMPEWAAAEADIDARYGLKTLLGAACGALAVAIVAVSMVAQQRKHRFLELKNDFIATVSHELRTPLASIRLLGETLERRLGHTEVAGDYPTRIVRAADGLHFLVENILSFNRIDKGRWKLQVSRVRLEELVGLLRDDLTDVVPVPVALTSDVDELELEADASLLRMLFANLGRNACAYNRRNPVELSMRATRVPGHGCTVLFSDNGVGIPESEWERVFQDFYRLSPPGQETQGSGLGLALCRRIMALHRGTLHIVASGPEGTTFALTFPESRLHP
ncbi:HAMP domain-containing histidine kinase [Myxococcaceae bacterium JPH2]|nr:HAMP domain-containing histidine kinase [Myxococcaceae bacterium JPH2]